MKYVLTLGFIWIAAFTFGQERFGTATDTLQHKIILIGDAGAIFPEKPSVLRGVKKHYQLDDKTTVIYLGDNLYTYGLPDETYQRYAEAKAPLDSQIQLTMGTPARAIMIPGNHDWANGASFGYENVVREQRYIDAYSDRKMNFYPKSGCPGPVEVEISKDVTLIVLDSQWWLHGREKPGVESDCDTKSEDEIVDELVELLIKNDKKLVLLATHHPFRSNGPHGGYYTLKQHIFPFTDLKKNLYIPMPVVGSIYPITRQAFGNVQDIPHPTYQNMVNKVMKEVKRHPNVLMVAGHEHSLQLLKDSGYHFIVSGSGCKSSRVNPGGNAMFQMQANGFSVVEVSKEKNVRVNFYKVDDPSTGDAVSQVYSENIINFSKLPEIEVEDTVKPMYEYRDFAKVPASSQYKNANGFKRMMNGSNYRAEWSVPVTLKEFNINKEQGGFKIEGLGGGNQTKTLHLEDKAGNRWSLRTIDKNPERLLPDNLRNTFVAKLMQDMISSQHPYAAKTTPSLARIAGIWEPERTYVYVPNDPAFGYYQPYFANKVAILEKRDPPGRETESTFKMIEKVREDNDNTIDQLAFLNIRMFDMFIGDWDRHFDQFRWTTSDTGKGKLWKPLPRDRDMVFFKNDGLIQKLIASRTPFFKGFDADINKMSELNATVVDADKLYLNMVDRHEWDSVATAFIAKMTDSAIYSSLKQMPPEAYAISGEKIAKKLFARRSQLHDAVMDYYDFLSKVVQITGSNEAEEYKVFKDDDGKLRIRGTIVSRKSDEKEFVTYNRSFDPEITKEIRLFGFNGDDRFIVDSGVDSRIKLRFVGGKGADSFYVYGKASVHVYDVKTEKNALMQTRGVHDHFRMSPTVNAYKLKSYQYDKFKFPKLNLGYNVDDGLLVGAGMSIVANGFRREPHASEHNISTLFALTQKGLQARYEGRFYDLSDMWDIMINSKLNYPGIQRFFGLGNETTFDAERRFYLARYKTVEADVLLNRPFSDRTINMMIGPSFQHYWARFKNNDEFILAKPQLIGLDSADVYRRKSYLGVKAGLDIDKLNSQIFPTSGIHWSHWITAHKGLADAPNDLLKYETHMQVYASRKDPARVTWVAKLGAGKVFTDSARYFQLLGLNSQNYLRGFYRNRFTGDGLAYGSLEARFLVAEFKNGALPAQFGLIAFNDFGRVWLKGENSKKWHYAYGGGLYYVPLKLVILSATVGHSADGFVYNVSLGTRFNLTFQ